MLRLFSGSWLSAFANAQGAPATGHLAVMKMLSRKLFSAKGTKHIKEMWIPRTSAEITKI